MKLSPFWRGFIFVLAATLLAGGIIFVNRILMGDAFSKEEAQHALYGLWLWRDIKSADWGAFWYDTQRQMFWPFLHSWILSIFFIDFGVSYVTARTLSLVLFLASVLLIYLLSNKISEDLGPRIGAAASLLALTSPLMLRFAAENMLEALGAFLFLAAAYTYTVCEERKITIEYVIVAVLIGLSIYTNYIYAYLMVLAFLFMTLIKVGPIALKAIKLRRRGEKEAIHFVWWAYRKVIVLIVFLVLIGAWFSFNFSRKILLLVNAIFKYGGAGEAQGLWQNLLYYPGVIVQHLAFSPWLGIFVLISLGTWWVASRYRDLDEIYAYIWVPLLLLTFTISAKSPRMFYIAAPFVFIAFSAALFFFLEKLRNNQKLAAALLLIIFLPACFSLPKVFSSFAPASSRENMRAVLNYFQDSLSSNASIAVPLNLQHLNPEGIEFHLRARLAPVLTDIQLGEEALFSQGEYLLTLELDEGSKYQAEELDESLYFWNALLKRKEMNAEIQLYSSRRFESIGVTAKIYVKLAR